MTKITRKVPEIHKPILRFLLKDPPPSPPTKALDSSGNARILPYWAPRVAVFIVTDTTDYPQMTEQYVDPFLLSYLSQVLPRPDTRTPNHEPLNPENPKLETLNP